MMVLVGITYNEIITRLIFGKRIPEQELDEFFGRHIEEYIRSGDGLLHGSVNLPYIARVPSSMFSKWYIGDGYGIIPRWSKWSKKITEICRKNKLSEL